MSENQPILLRDILIRARQESLHMRHYFLGVEHLFLALLQIQGGLAQCALQDQGISVQKVITAIRRKTGVGNTQASWPGVRYTPRTYSILDMANDIALNNNRSDITERDLFSAIVSEKESLPMRLLRIMGADLTSLEQAARIHTLVDERHLPDVVVEFGPKYDKSQILSEQLFILRRMFSTYAKIRVERRLTGFRKALVLVITPIHADNEEDASVVVKIDQAEIVREEAQHYEEHIKNAATPFTARLEEAPIIPEDSLLGGLKYTLVANAGTIPLDLRNRIQQQGTEELPHLLYEMLYNRFKKYWWEQRRPYRFYVWTEYDWVLPSVLILDLKPTLEPPAGAHVLRIPFKRAHLKNTLKTLKPGDYIILENFTVQKVDTENKILKLALKYGTDADNRAFRVDVRLPNADRSYYRGEIIDRLVGTVWKTRDDALLDAVRALTPSFDPRQRMIPVDRYQMVNPLQVYDTLLDHFMHGTTSRIHGDLNLSNILLGPENGLWLIDFGHTRNGHTLFDWAVLEISLLGDAVMSLVGESWDNALKMLRAISPINKSKAPPQSNNANINHALQAVMAIRQIVGECLVNKDHWEEYYIALALCALRAITWETMPLGGRRLMFLFASLLTQEILSQSNITSTDTPSPDITENLPAVRQVTDLGLESRDDMLPIEQSSRIPLSPVPFQTKRLEDSESAKELERLESEKSSDETHQTPPENRDSK
ncbi:MAG: phosphotransferase [Anaerolineae bacterium]|nr:phosphotransferase [Anaerolineae bacterium]